MASSKLQTVKIETRRLDSSSGPMLRRLMDAAWRESATIAVLDLSEVVYIDSLGISALISEYRRRPAGTRLVLCSVGDYVRDVLEVTQLFRIFDVFASSQAASAALSV